MTQSLLNDLRSRLRGTILEPGDTGYDDTRSLWNGMIDRRPAAIVRCLGVADVVACVNAAREHGVELSVKGGGHNIAGLAVCDGGLMLDMSAMRGVWVDAAARIAHAQPGCLLGDVDRETQLHGLATVLGFVSNTGIAGLTLGGGFGYLTRRFGWTCDNVMAMDVVTADGRLVRASEEENADLFWGLRGGGGNFGVVTNFTYRLHPVGPEIYGGGIAWRATEAESVMEAYHNLVTSAPPELTCALALRIAPPAPWLPPEVHGTPIVLLLACHTGSIEEGERLLAPMRACGSPVGDIVMRRPYVVQQTLIDATQPKGRRYYWKSEYLPKIEPTMLSAAIEHAKGLASPHSGIVIFPIDGALNRLPHDYSPAGNRDAGAVFTITASWESPDDDARNIEWARTAWQEMRRFSTGGTYVNFLTEEENDDRIRAAYGANYDRLAAVKTRWDPTNLFRTNKNILPAAESRLISA